MNEKLEQTFELSSRKRRIVAFIIDHFVITFLIVSIMFLVFGTDFIDESNMVNMTTKMLAVMLPGFFLYFAKDTFKGISVGRWVMEIMVRDKKSPTEIPSFERLFLRNLLIVIWPIEFIVLAASQQKRRLGDEIAKTIVVKNPNKPKKLPRIFTLISVGLVFFTFIFFFIGTAIKNSDVYKVAIHEIENNQEILKETGGIKGYGMVPTGNVTVSDGNGQAQFEIKVIGNDKDLNIRVYLTKEPNGKWKLIEMER